jgi:uncharacterized membrane protein
LAVVSSVAALAFVVAAPRAGQNFTEFYVLGPGGRAIGYPQNLTVGQSAFVVLGITNHENRQVAYFVQTWLVNATLVNNNTVIKDMFFFNQWSAVLDSTASNLEGPSVLQFEKDYHFSVNATGQYKLWFFLFKDSVPSYAQNLTPMQNYTGGPTDQLLDYAVDGNTTVLTALSLNLLVKSP